MEDSYRTKAWHGTNLRGSLRGVSAAEAAWRPAAGRHNIWEIVVHAAYWKYAVRRRLTGAKRGSFPLSGRNWITRPVRDGSSQWQDDLHLLKMEHEALMAVIRILKNSRAPGVERLLYGIAAHDAYHTGQIQLLKRLQRRS